MEKMTAQRLDDLLYSELSINFAGLIGFCVTLVVTLITIPVFIMFFIRGDEIQPIGLILVLGFGLGIAFLAFNFINYDLIITSAGIRVSYKLFRHVIPWDNIQSYGRRKYPGLIFQSLWGIGIGLIEGKLALYYHTWFPASDVILIENKQGFFKFFGFSTKRPDEVISLVDRWKK
jgi:hypothetical protein